MPGSGKRRPRFTLVLEMSHGEALVLYHLVAKYLGVYYHRPTGCPNDGCPCFANGYEWGREDERAERPEPLRDEGRD